jgi:3-methyl-2-oxobutanoate hydroxymethyltransferase
VDCDGQILVLHDMLGLAGKSRHPRFVKDFMPEGGSIAGAIKAYADAVRGATFPTLEHGYD